MAQLNSAVLGFNGGIISKSALARTDMERVKVSCEQMLNYWPCVIGDMKTRPGTKYLGTSRSNFGAKLVPFVYSAAETAFIELTNGNMRVWVSDAVITRASVSTAVANGGFTGSLASWTDDDESGAASTHSSNKLKLVGTGTSYARVYQQVTVGAPDQNVRHALDIVVTLGPVKIMVGSTATNGSYISETVLRTGHYSLSFIPTGNFYIVLYSKDVAERYVDSVDVASSGAMTLTTPWSLAESQAIRYEQSGDVIFCAVSNVKQRRIERYDFFSWGVAEYDTSDGPFRPRNLDTNVTITPSATTGNITLEASDPIFYSTHVGSIWQLTHPGQNVVKSVTAQNQFTDPIRVTGINESTVNTRSFHISISNTFTATVTLQRSFGTPGAWVDVTTWTAPTEEDYADDFDNQIVYYRIGVDTGDFTSGQADLALTYNNSLQNGTVRITAYTDADTVSAEVLSTLGGMTATSEWREGCWSSRRGYPSAVEIHDGRLWWAMDDFLYGSVSDAFESYDQAMEGDSGPIVRSIAVGPVEGILWLESQQRLLCGSASQEVSIRSSSFDEPLTPTKFSARKCSNRGSANVPAVSVDTSVIFTSRDGTKLYELYLNAEAQDYSVRDLTRLNPDILNAGVAVMAVSRQPETRIWCVLEDGTIAVLLFEKADSVIGWSTIETSSDGDFEDVCVLPGNDEDQIYFVVKRIITGPSTKRYIEKMGKQSEMRCGTTNKAADCHVVWAAGGTGSPTGLDHLNGLGIVVWYNGSALVTAASPVTVSGGTATLPGSINAGAVLGLPFTQRYKSMKLAFGASAGTALMQRKRVEHLGLLMTDTSWAGTSIGPSFAAGGAGGGLRALPKMFQAEEVGATYVFTDYDFDMTNFNGGFDTDARICIQTICPHAANIRAMVIGQATNDEDRQPKAAPKER